MKICFYLLLMIIAISTTGHVAYAAGMNNSPIHASPAAAAGQLHKAEKAQKKWHKWQLRWEKLKRKAGEVWDDGKFRIGVILLGAALILALVSIIISLGGLIDIIAGLLALGGIALIIWGLVTTYG